MKNKKHKKRSQENEAVDDATDQEPVKERKKKKKRLKEAETTEVQEATDEQDQPVKEKKRKKKNKDKQVEVSDTDEPRTHAEAPKKKKKKSKKLQEEEQVVDSSPPPKKKKKKTRCKDEHASNSVDQENVECTEEVAEVSSKKKRKKSKKDKQGAVADGNGDKEPGMKTQQAVPDLGQWSTADLGDSSRQNKFYQLLGGFKSSSADTKSKKPFAAKFNAALDKMKETQLNNQLERQFEEARLAQFSAKGVGLGFTQPKKNHIDINTCRSKKFDD